MAWIPDVSRTLVIIKRLEKQEELLEDSIELFQVFFNHTYSPEQFAKRMEELNRNRVEHEPNSGVALNDVRNLYRAYLGIGRQGVIPELVRLLGRVSK